MAILNSQIARLVLDYLREENLESAKKLFCKTSPYLKEEYEVLSKGYNVEPMFDCSLVSLIQDYCEIRHMVNQVYATHNELPKANTVKQKLKYLLYEQPPNEIGPSTKRRRSSVGDDKTEPTIKRARYLENFIVLSNPSGDQLSPISSQIDNLSPIDHTEMNREVEIDPEDVNCQSIRSDVASRVQYPILSETILENTRFQNVLLENITKYLEPDPNIDIETTQSAKRVVNKTLQEQLDRAIENILLTTEQDPAFEEVVEEVVMNTDLQTGCNRLSSTSTPSIEIDKQSKRRVSSKSTDSVDKPKEIEIISNEPYTGPVYTTGDSFNTTQLTQMVVVNNQIDNNEIGVANNELNQLNYQNSSYYVNIPIYVQSEDGQLTTYPLLVNSMQLNQLTTQSFDTNKNGPEMVEALSSGTTVVQDNVGMEQTVPEVVSKIPESVPSVEITPKIQKPISSKKIRSLSSPKRRASHVRTLVFATPAPVDVSTVETTTEINESKTPKTQINSTIPNSAPSKFEYSTRRTKLTTMPTVSEESRSISSIDFGRSHDEATCISVDNGSTCDTPRGSRPKRKCVVRQLTKRKEIPKKRKGKVDQPSPVKASYEEWNQYRSIGVNWVDHLRTVCSKNDHTTKRKLRRRGKGKLRPSGKKSLNCSTESNQTDEKADNSLDIDESNSPKTNQSKESIDQKTDKKSVEKPKVVRKKIVSQKVASKKVSPQKVSIRKESSETKIGEESAKKSPIELDTIRQHIQITDCVISIRKLKDPSIDTPFKFDPLQYPKTPDLKLTLETPNFVVGGTTDTNKSLASMIKDIEFPTPNFPITPGAHVGLTPFIKDLVDGTVTSSPFRSGDTLKSRPTDYSSGSSYYRPDESDDIDRNINSMVRQSLENRPNTVPVDRDNQTVDRSNEIIASTTDDDSSADSEKIPIQKTEKLIVEETKSIEKCAMPKLTPGKLAMKDRLEATRRRVQNRLKEDEEAKKRPPTTTRKVKPTVIKKQVVEIEKGKENEIDKAKEVAKSIQATVGPNSTEPTKPSPSKRKIATPRKITYMPDKGMYVRNIPPVGKPETKTTKKSPGRSPRNIPKKLIKIDVPADTVDKTQRLLSESSDNAIMECLPNETKSVVINQTEQSVHQQTAQSCSMNSFETMLVKDGIHRGNAKELKRLFSDYPDMLEPDDGQAENTERKPESTGRIVSDKSNNTTTDTSPPPHSHLQVEERMRQLFGDTSDSDFLETPIKKTDKMPYKPKVMGSTMKPGGIMVRQPETLPDTCLSQTKELHTVEELPPTVSLSLKTIEPKNDEKRPIEKEQKIVKSDNNESDEEDVNERDLCTINRFDENDKNHYFTVTHDGSNATVSGDEKPIAFTTTNIFINGQKVRLSVCDPIGLFTMEPQSKMERNLNDDTRKLTNKKQTTINVQVEKRAAERQLRSNKAYEVSEDGLPTLKFKVKSLPQNQLEFDEQAMLLVTSTESRSTPTQTAVPSSSKSSITTRTLSVSMPRVSVPTKNMDINLVLDHLYPNRD